MSLTPKQLELEPLLRPVHRHMWKFVAVKFSKKISSMTSNAKNRYTNNSEPNANKDFSSQQLRILIENAYGMPCKYCNNTIKLQNMTVDHIVPLNRMGIKGIDNIQIICGRCNTRKGVLTHNEYEKLRHLITMNFNKEAIAYIFRKLAMADKWGT